MDQHAPASTAYGSHATPLHVVQTEGRHRRIDTPVVVSPQDDLRNLQDLHDHTVPSSDGQGCARQDSVSSDLPVPRSGWSYRDRRSPSPVSSKSRSPPRSPPYRRKWTHSKTPPRFEVRQAGDHWEPADRPMHPRVDDYQDRLRRSNGYNWERQPVSPHRYRGQPPQRAFNGYRPSPSPPPPPQQFRGEPPRRGYYDVPP